MFSIILAVLFVIKETLSRSGSPDFYKFLPIKSYRSLVVYVSTDAYPLLRSEKQVLLELIHILEKLYLLAILKHDNILVFCFSANSHKTLNLHDKCARILIHYLQWSALFIKWNSSYITWSNLLFAFANASNFAKNAIRLRVVLKILFTITLLFSLVLKRIRWMNQTTGKTGHKYFLSKQYLLRQVWMICIVHLSFTQNAQLLAFFARCVLSKIIPQK